MPDIIDMRWHMTRPLGGRGGRRPAKRGQRHDRPRVAITRCSQGICQIYNHATRIETFCRDQNTHAVPLGHLRETPDA